MGIVTVEDQAVRPPVLQEKGGRGLVFFSFLFFCGDWGGNECG